MVREAACRLGVGGVDGRRAIMGRFRGVSWTMGILVPLSVSAWVTRSRGAAVSVVTMVRAEGPGRPSAMTEVTRILAAIEQGDPTAAEQLLPLVYDELRKLAAQKLAHEAPGQTLQATALVHEAYVRLVD